MPPFSGTQAKNKKTQMRIKKQRELKRSENHKNQRRTVKFAEKGFTYHLQAGKSRFWTEGEL